MISKGKEGLIVILMIQLLVGSSLIVTSGQDNTGETICWNEIETTNSPERRVDQNWVHDTTRDQLLMIGGRNGPTLADTWIYDPNDMTWEEVPTSNQPELSRFGVAYDTESDKTVTFGGLVSSTAIDDTWLYDNELQEWTLLSPNSSPSARLNAEMIYSPVQDKIILFGGEDLTGTYFGDTWEFDVATGVWTELTPVISPVARSGHSMIYEKSKDTIILSNFRLS